MKSIFIYILLVLILTILNCQSDVTSKNEVTDEINFILENEEMLLNVSRNGGMFTRFILKRNELNPFGWILKPEQMPKNNQPHAFAGHFLCTGRWGAPSEGEMSAGVPHNGEVNTQEWKMISNKALIGGATELVMTCEAPIEKLDVTRTIRVPKKGGYFVVNETFVNNLPVARLTNFVQHGTVAAPFLSSETIINTNAGNGFDQRTSISALNDSAFTWPNAKLVSGVTVDLRKLDIDEGFVTSHIFPENESIGWITAYNPEKKIIMGYVFDAVQYRWFNYWHQPKNGQSYVRGLEFGTTGIGKPFNSLVSESSSFFGVPSFQYIDAGEKIEKWWLCFQMELTIDIENVESVRLQGSTLVLWVIDNKKTVHQVEMELEDEIMF
jgi:hypothetical protein